MGDEIANETLCNFLHPLGVPVASYPANGYGLFDMAGSVPEWTADKYLENAYSLTASSVVDPKGPTEKDGWVSLQTGDHCVRGGYIGVAFSRYFVRNTSRIATILAGFRVVADLDGSGSIA